MSRASGTVPWAPSLHSQTVVVEVILRRFCNHSSSSGIDPDLCVQCMADILLLLIVEHLEAKATIQFPKPITGPRVAAMAMQTTATDAKTIEHLP